MKPTTTKVTSLFFSYEVWCSETRVSLSRSINTFNLTVTGQQLSVSLVPAGSQTVCDSGPFRELCSHVGPCGQCRSAVHVTSACLTCGRTQTHREAPAEFEPTTFLLSETTTAPAHIPNTASTASILEELLLTLPVKHCQLVVKFEIKRSEVFKSDSFKWAAQQIFGSCSLLCLCSSVCCWAPSFTTAGLHTASCELWLHPAVVHTSARQVKHGCCQVCAEDRGSSLWQLLSFTLWNKQKKNSDVLLTFSFSVESLLFNLTLLKSTDQKNQTWSTDWINVIWSFVCVYSFTSGCLHHYTR